MSLPTSVLSATHSPFLVDVFKPHSYVKQIILTTLAACIFGLTSNFSIPMTPVPLTFQSFIILLMGATLGRKLGLIAMLQVVVMGLMGLPMFADGSMTLSALLSPSAGYIYGFFASIYLAAWATERGLDRHFLLGLCAFAVAHQIIFVIGVVYLSFYLNTSLEMAFKLGYLPFLGFDAVKFTSAALIMYVIWKSRQ